MIAMISRLIGSVTPILLALLLGIAVYAGMQARHYADQASDAEARVARAEDRAAILLEHQRWQNQQIETMAAALGARDEQLQRDGELLDLVRQAARNLERDDAKTADWAGQPSPAAVRQWLRDLQRDDNGADSSSTGGAEFSGQPFTGPEPASNPQP